MVRTCQKAGISTNSSRNYEKVPPVQKRLKMLKEFLPEVIDPILPIINLLMALGYVPNTFKLAVIKPLIKKTQLDPN